MKKYILAILLIACSLGQAKAQDLYDSWDILAGVKAGVSMSTLTKLSGDPMIGPHGAAMVETFLTPYLAWEIEVQLTHKGMRNVYYQGVNGPYEYRFDYVGTSNLWKYVFLGQHLDVYTGWTVGRLFNAKSEFEGHSTNIRGHLHYTDFAVPFGAEVRFGRFCLDARWNWCPVKLADSDKAKNILGPARHQSFIFTVGYKFPVLH